MVSRRGGVWSVWPAMAHGLDEVWEGVEPRAGAVVVVLPVAGDGRLGLVSADGSRVLPASAERVAAVVESALADPVVGADGRSAVQLIPVYPADAGGVRDRGVLVESVRALVERSGRHVYLPPLPGDSRPVYDLAARLRAAQLPGGRFRLPVAGPGEGALVPVPDRGVGRVYDVGRDGNCFVSALATSAYLRAPELELAGLVGASAERVAGFRRETGQAFRNDADLFGPFAGGSSLSMVLPELSDEQLNELRLHREAAVLLNWVDAGDLRPAVHQLLEAGVSVLWEELAALFDGEGRRSLGDLVRELRAGQVAGQLPDVAEMYARAIERTDLWDTPFGEAVPEMIARLRHPVIILEQGRPPHFIGSRDDAREPLYVLRTDSGGVGTAHYLAVDPPTADTARAGAGQVRPKRVRQPSSEGSVSGRQAAPKRPRLDEPAGHLDTPAHSPSDMDISDEARSEPDHQATLPAATAEHRDGTDSDMDISEESGSDRATGPAPERQAAARLAPGDVSSSLTSPDESEPEESSADSDAYEPEESVDDSDLYEQEDSDGYETGESDRELSDAESQASDDSGVPVAQQPGRPGRATFEAATTDWVDPAGLTFEPPRRLLREQREQRLAAIEEITEHLDAITNEPPQYSYGRTTPHMWARHRRSYAEERLEQSLQHFSRVLRNVIRSLQREAEAESSRQAGEQDPAAGPSTAAPPRPQQFKREAEVQAMLVNGRLVVATNQQGSITLLTRAVDALRANAQSADGGVVQRLLDIHHGRVRAGRRVETSKAKLHSAWRGQRPGTEVTDILRDADRVEEAVAAPYTEDGFRRLRELLTDERHQGTVILLRRSARRMEGRDAEHGMHSELKLLLALHTARLGRSELTGDLLIRGTKRPCATCWAALTWAALDLQRGVGRRLSFSDRLGVWFKQSAIDIATHLPHVLNDPSGLPGNFVVNALRDRAREQGGTLHMSMSAGGRTYARAGQGHESGSGSDEDGRSGLPAAPGGYEVLAEAGYGGGGATTSDSDVVGDDVAGIWQAGDRDWAAAFGQATRQDLVSMEQSRSAVRTTSSGRLTFTRAGVTEWTDLGSQLTDTAVRPEVDFGTLQIRLLDPQSGEPVHEPITMFDSWLLDHNSQGYAVVDSRGEVWVGTAIVALGLSRAGARVRLQGHPPTGTGTTGTVAIHAIRDGAELARVAVFWTPEPRPAADRTPEIGEYFTGFDGGPVLMPFESGFPHAGVVEHPSGVVLRVPGRTDGRVGLGYDRGSGEALAFDLARPHQVLGRRVTPPPPSGPVYQIKRRGTVNLPDNDGNRAAGFQVARPRKDLTEVEVHADFGRRNLSFFQPPTGTPVAIDQPFPPHWPTLTDGGAVRSTVNRSGYVYAGPIPMRVDRSFSRFQSIDKRAVVLIGRSGGPGGRGTVTAYAPETTTGRPPVRRSPGSRSRGRRARPATNPRAGPATTPPGRRPR